MTEGTYDVAQVCLNGHKINSCHEDLPQYSSDHCSDCGASTITACPSCDVSIRGYVRGSMSFAEYVVPKFCSACGEPYPWTASALEAAKAMAEEIGGLSEDERSALSASLEDLVRDTPRSPVAAMRFKRYLAKAGTSAASAFKDILIGVISESAKRAIWP